MYNGIFLFNQSFLLYLSPTIKTIAFSHFPLSGISLYCFPLLSWLLFTESYIFLSEDLKLQVKEICDVFLGLGYLTIILLVPFIYVARFR